MAKKRVKKSKSRRPRRRGRSRVGALGSSGVSLETLGAVIAGGMISKASNGIVKNVDFLTKNKWLMPALKVGGGYAAATYSRAPFIQGMGAGAVLEGFFHGLEVFAPNVFAKIAGGRGRGVGYTLIDLDEVPGMSGYRGNGMEDEQAVNGLYSTDAGVV